MDHSSQVAQLEKDLVKARHDDPYNHSPEIKALKVHPKASLGFAEPWNLNPKP